MLPFPCRGLAAVGRNPMSGCDVVSDQIESSSSFELRRSYEKPPPPRSVWTTGCDCPGFPSPRRTFGPFPS